MMFTDYQQQSRKTAIYPNMGADLIYPTLGLVGEAGEIAEKIKKMIRDDGGMLTAERRDLLKKELGDVMWYLAQLCTELGFDMDEVANHNLEKLFSRKDRGKLTGDGDTR
ncbi:nucleoside triphosphate pyrophosphohydrolase family protein [Candidatus Uhrbacteria bacterium]|jgi:NTP pyrophosphatase (non-canonical NTP hydrolase)|nr:nucleoside triphosphate pyrophosphohydrolase family protein [Candidatus Uhrbacteria bacterium]